MTVTGRIDMGRTILAVDDDATILRFVQSNLEKHGYTVLTAADGAAALRVIGEERPDAVILDVEMPEMSGVEVVRRLRQDPATASLPVIMLTGRDDLQDIFEGVRAGADVYMPKPFRLPRLLEVVDTVFEPRR